MWKAVAVACAAGVALSLPVQPVPARYRTGGLPALPLMALAGGQVFVELAVTSEGRVAAVVPLRTTSPFTDPVVDAVRGWTFVAAHAETPIESTCPRLPTSCSASLCRSPKDDGAAYERGDRSLGATGRTNAV